MPSRQSTPLNAAARFSTTGFGDPPASPYGARASSAGGANLLVSMPASPLHPGATPRTPLRHGPSPRTPGAGTKRLEVESVARDFVQNLDELMGVLRASQLKFVRCIKPNAQLAPGVFSPKMVLRQLRCAGTHEAVQVMKLAYLSRVPYEHLLALLKPAVPPGFDGARIDRAYFVRKVLPELAVPAGSFALGRTRVFLKATAAGHLASALQALQGETADKSLLALCQSAATEAAGRHSAALTIGAAARGRTDREHFLKMRAAASRAQKGVRSIWERRAYIEHARRLAVELLAWEAAEKKRIAEDQLRAKAALREAMADAKAWQLV